MVAKNKRPAAVVGVSGVKLAYDRTHPSEMVSKFDWIDWISGHVPTVSQTEEEEDDDVDVDDVVVNVVVRGGTNFVVVVSTDFAVDTLEEGALDAVVPIVG